MALSNFSILATPSGKIGGLVFSHNRGGRYIRALSIPTNPNTIFQQAVRTLMGSLSSIWVDILTQAQRDSWDTYALNVLLPNRIGELVNVGGLGMFQRSNVSRLQALETTLTEVDQAPTIFNLGEFTAPVFAAPAVSTQDVSMAFTAADAWVDETGAAMMVYVSRPKNPSINYFQGPYRYAGLVLGDGTTAPTSPATISLPFTVAAGHKVFFRTKVTRVDGRLSTDFRDSGIAA